MQKQLPSQYFDTRPIKAIKSRIEDLEKRYARLCRYFRKNPSAGIEKREKFASMAVGICREISTLESELSSARKLLAEMKEKHSAFMEYLDSRTAGKTALRAKFAEKYGRVPEECFHEFQVLSGQIARIEGPQSDMGAVKAGIKSFFWKKQD